MTKLPQESPSKFGQHSNLTVDDCFEQFMAKETLNSSNSWYCDNCKLKQNAIKRIQIYQVAPILVICLKRFKTFRQKDNAQVKFPLRDFDLTKYVLSDNQRFKKEELIYDLVGVSNHHGSSLQAGHYTAYCKN